MKRLRMGRNLLGWTPHHTSGFILGGLIVDPGPPATEHEMLRVCRTLGLEKILLTHHHEDHCGGAPILVRELHLPVYAPAGAVGMLSTGLRMPLYRKIYSGVPAPFEALALGETISSGEHVLEVIPTPGHASDHACFFERKLGILFSGDLYLNERVKLLRKIEDPWLHMESLRRIAALDPGLLACSQMGFVENPREAIERKILWWEEIATRCHALRKEGASETEIARRLLGRNHLLTWLSQHDFSTLTMVRALLRGPGGRGSGAP